MQTLRLRMRPRRLKRHCMDRCRAVPSPPLATVSALALVPQRVECKCDSKDNGPRPGPTNTSTLCQKQKKKRKKKKKTRTDNPLTTSRRLCNSDKIRTARRKLRKGKQTKKKTPDSRSSPYKGPPEVPTDSWTPSAPEARQVSKHAR